MDGVASARWIWSAEGHAAFWKAAATEARAGVTGHNVHYVLAASLIGVIIVFGGLWYFWAG